MLMVFDSGQWAEEIKAIEAAFAGEEAANTTGGGTPPPVEAPMAMNDLPEPVPPQRE
jgi:hypothetical protein